MVRTPALLPLHAKPCDAETFASPIRDSLATDGVQVGQRPKWNRLEVMVVGDNRFVRQLLVVTVKAFGVTDVVAEPDRVQEQDQRLRPRSRRGSAAQSWGGGDARPLDWRFGL